MIILYAPGKTGAFFCVNFDITKKAIGFSTDGFGPSGESRTHGLLNPIQARYQTALHPDNVPFQWNVYYYIISCVFCQHFIFKLFRIQIDFPFRANAKPEKVSLVQRF